MRAAVIKEYGSPEVIALETVTTPSPGAGEVRVAVRAVGLNHLDLFVRRGIEGLELPLPHIGGSDVAGIVDAAGHGVTGWAPGTEVIVNPSLPCHSCSACEAGDTSMCRTYRILGEHVAGGMAEYVVVPADRLYPKPAALDWVEAAAVPLAFQTAWRALITRAQVRPGEDVLVLGASGGVASVALQIAHLAGARVIAITSSAGRCDLARELGAEVAIDRTAEPWAKAAWLATGRRGADVVVENVGAATWFDSLRSAAPGGRIVTYGATTGPRPETDLRYIFWKQLTILGTTMGSDADFRAVMRLVDRGLLKPIVGQVLSLDEARRAHELLEAGDVTGKVVMTVGEDRAAG